MNETGPDFLGRLLDRHAAALVLFARQWCGMPEDVVQEAFVRFAGQNPAPREPAAWLYKVVRNRAISAGRAETRRRRHEAAAAALAVGWFEESSDMSLDAQSAQAALAALCVEECEVIVAHIWGGLTFTQIADLVGASSSTVHRRYQSGLVNLRNSLGETCLPNIKQATRYPKI
jgi:RNA polymerase sigma-70 factor (ECF subfamily)